MSSTTNYDSGSTPILPGRNVVLKNLRAPNAEINSLSVDLINGLPPPTASPIVAPVGSILTVISPATAGFSQDVDILGNLDLNGVTGSSGQYVKKTGAATQTWSNITSSDITAGLANQVLTTFGSSASWNLLTQSNFAPNSLNSVFYTNSIGVAQCGKLPVQNINQGTAGQILTTNSLGTAPTWSSTITCDSLTFNTDANQDTLNYYNQVFNDVLPVTYEDGTTGFVDVTYQRIGSKVSIRVDTLSVTYATASTFYRVIGPIPVIYRPLYGVSPSYNDWHSECFPCEQSISGNVSGSGFIGNNGNIVIFTNVNRSIPAAGTCTSNTHTFNYMLD